MKKITLLLSAFSLMWGLNAQNKDYSAKQQQKNQIILNQTQTPAHRTCGTMDADAALRAAHPELGTLEDFEEWLAPRVEAYKQAVANGTAPEVVYTIPVIVHIIHNGEAVGTGSNISQAQVQSQIDRLNEDYRRLNSDTTNTPSAFTSVAADCQINFCLAQVDPNGNTLTEPGIDRVNRNTAGFPAPPYTQGTIDGTIKPATSWNPNQYMNIWVLDLGGGLLGYAQFPSNTGLGGLNNNGGATNTDGVVIGYKNFGDITKVTTSQLQAGAPYNIGRTATHEVGHWLGLRHIWGDANCGNDFCNDTPTQQTSNYGCPTFPNVTCGNGPNGDMFMNYMDYVDDNCMNTFTLDQKARMVVVMTQGTPRAALVNSTVCNTASVGDDAGISSVTTPTGTLCATSFTPVVVLRNNGSTTLTSVTINYYIDANAPSTFSWTGSLAPNSTATVTLPSMTATAGTHTFTASTSLPNGVADVNPANDAASSSFTIVGNGVALPFTEGFEGTTFIPAGWTLNNPDASTTWARTTAAASTGTASAFMDYYNYNAAGAIDEMVTPNIDLTTQSNPQLTFQVAYQLYTDPTAATTYSDTLEVLITTDCGATYTSLYKKFGAQLTTTTPTFSTTSFVPTANDWRMETIDLTPYATATNAQIVFRGIGDYENELYIDDINISGGIITGITSNTTTQVNMYPNPSQGQLFISTSKADKYTVTVVNMVGNVVKTTTFNNTFAKINLSNQANGIYFVTIKGANVVKTEKIIISK